MGITLGTHTFDASRTAVREQHQEVGGQDARRIEIKGVIDGAATIAELEAALDAVLGAASESGESTSLSLREGRELRVYRRGFSREIHRSAGAARYTLELEAPDPYEWSILATQVTWAIGAPGAAISLNTAGNAPASVSLAMTAQGSLVAPSISDGERTLTYLESLPAGGAWFFDTGARIAFAEGEDVLPYVSGEFPALPPEGAVWTYDGDVTSSHLAEATLFVRDRWW